MRLVDNRQHSDGKMFSLKGFIVLLITGCVYANPIHDDCKDDACWREGISKFLHEYAGGDGEKGVTPMDPMIVENINVPEEALDINSHFSELIVGGLKDATVTDFSKVADDKGHIGLKFKMDAEGPVSLQLVKKHKHHDGTIQYEADISSEISYTFSVEKNEIGPETVACEASNVKVTIPKELYQAQEADPDVAAIKEQYNAIHDEHIKKVACEIAKSMLKNVMANLRALAAHKP